MCLIVTDILDSVQTLFREEYPATKAAFVVLVLVSVFLFVFLVL